MLLVKPGVQFTTIAPGGFRLLAALDDSSRFLDCDLTITAACDGAHSGPDDPHHLGRAYDVRSHDTPATTLVEVLTMLDDGELVESSGGYVTDHFFGWLEDAGTTNEHYHFQQRHGIDLS